jgi:hypothetical protein
MDGTLGTLDDEVLELVIGVFTNELQHIGIIHIGGAGEAHALFPVVLHLVQAPRVAGEREGDASGATRPEDPGHRE